jgi:cell division protein FtsL
MSSPLPQSRIRVQRIAEAAVERARLTVVPRTHSRAPRVPFVTLVSLVLLAGVVGLLMFNTSMQQSSFQATALETQADDLRSQEQELRSQLEGLRDPQRIGEWARENGLVLSGSPVFLQLDGRGGGRLEGDGSDVAEPFDVAPKALKPKSLIPEVIEIKAKRKKPATSTTTRNRDTRRGSPAGRR